MHLNLTEMTVSRTIAFASLASKFRFSAYLCMTANRALQRHVGKHKPTRPKAT